MESYKNIACVDFVNVNIPLNSYAYEKTQHHLLSLFKSFKLRHLSHHNRTLTLCTK